jgi:4-amino-4-deoxy-L-arabinose transferase-like glycosyltransferase
MGHKKALIILVLILAAGAFLRLYHYDVADVINDEVFYGYRSIGLVDSLNSPFQPTPYEWYQEIPAWAKLSFHDHPPLGFWIQHVFFRRMGDTLLAMRLPFMLAGIFSIVLIYLISRELFQKQEIALTAAALMSVSAYPLFVSRIGLQEGLVIFFMLLAVWLFLKTLRDTQFFYWTAIAVGLAMLMKYTAVVLLPVFGIFLFWKRRDLLIPKRVIISAVIILAILSPVIVYNIGLYQERGHFDFQISYLLGQDVPEWEIRPGREVGGLGDKFTNLFARFSQHSGLLFSTLTVFALVMAWFRKKDEKIQFLILTFIFLVPLILVIGPQERFLAMLSPPLVILIAYALWQTRFKKFVLAALGVIIALELVFTINTFHASTPRGSEGWHYSVLRRDANAWGYNELEQELQKITQGSYPAFTFPLRFEFARELQSEALAEAEREGLEPKSIMFVTDSRIHGLSSLWYFTRMTVYHAWPVLSDETYLNATAQDPEFFRSQGIGSVIFIKAEDTLLKPDISTDAVLALEQLALDRGSKPREIISKSGKLSFLIYDF